MSTEGEYYVPESSKLPLFAAIGLGIIAVGAGSWVQGQSSLTFWVGSFVIAATLYKWFSIVINENMAGMNSDQLKRSYELVYLFRSYVLCRIFWLSMVHKGISFTLARR